MAEKLRGKNDAKLTQLVGEISKLLNEGYSPVIFCRFIATANYLAEQLRSMLLNTDVQAVTSQLAPAERELAVATLGQSEKRVLIATDCLSEGINLQEHFNAIIHYDLSWNPGRHEQREGRVDRFGQPAREVRVITWWGADNPMDGMILDVLLRKHVAIRQSLGISVPVPVDSEKVLETLFRGLLLANRPHQKTGMLLLPSLDDWFQREKNRINSEWEKIEAAEAKRSRTLFRQAAIRPEEAVTAANEALGASGDSLAVRDFVLSAWQLLGGKISRSPAGQAETWSVSFNSAIPDLKLPQSDQRFCFDLPAGTATYLHRTHPLVESLASYLAQVSLDNGQKPLLPRCGAMRANSVSATTTLLLCRFRFQIIGDNAESLAEECLPVAFGGEERLSDEKAVSLLACQPDGNCASGEIAHWLEKAIAAVKTRYQPKLQAFQEERASILLASHRRGRKGKWRVQSQGEPDILGIFVYLPNGGDL